MHKKFSLFIFLLLCCAPVVAGQMLTRDFSIQPGGTVEVINNFGRVDAIAETEKPDDQTADLSEINQARVSLRATSSSPVSESELEIDASGGRIRIEVVPANSRKRIDIGLNLPVRSRLKINTLEGEVRVSGDLELVEIKTETGTIAADVPTDNLKYSFLWTASRPRFLSDFELEKMKEKSGGRFEIKGIFKSETDTDGRGEAKSEPGETGPEPPATANGSTEATDLPARTPIADESAERQDLSVPPAVAGGSSTETLLKDRSDKRRRRLKLQKLKTITLNFTTARGIILLNIPVNEVTSDLRERPLTVAAKAVIRSGDSLLMDAIRRASPKYFGDYTRTLPPLKREPSFAGSTAVEGVPAASIKKASVRVTDLNNRAIGGLQAKDFEVVENNTPREILSVQATTAPFNLVLLLDVSGSVDNFVDFIRKAARNFVDTVDRQDRISIVTFNEDVKVISRFTTDKASLSNSLDTLDAGGGTAYYDALAYTLADTLRPLKGERTAIVVLTDGDDNRSFLAFESLLGSIQESGALIYPLYVPSALIAASAAAGPNAAVDPFRSRYMSLTSKAEGEGERLAKVSGGVYYPITQISQIQKAYIDIVAQLRTAYTITFRSETAAVNAAGTPPRLKIKSRKPNTFVSIGSVVKVPERE